ncbi:hypothetical protein GCM10023085_46100 [Actinomadura viridis]|uniref:Uncharacterized protein n=1 Tax=Actinomadura viridis TaxID=58110 RepID=A0A931DMS1_9ACTN|nr:hypothetical protein [Actinomadura viridis]MBG6089970.1 hypothetical protein [Actinomadura viridis]
MAEYPDYDVHRFLPDVADHEMTVLHDDGLYRHLRFKAPGHGFSWFDLITWPWTLAFRGDMGGFMFSRVEDMFQFFRHPGINPNYWAEKTPAGRDSVTAYDIDLFKQQVTEHVAQAIRDREAPKGISRAIRHMFEQGDITWEGGARDELEYFEYEGFRFTDTFEWDFRDFTWQFLWACHAIRWGIEQYDAALRVLATTEREVVGHG